jgi:hypothetical protein
MTPRTYTVQIAAELAQQFTDWTRVSDLDVDEFKVDLREDGTAEVILRRTTTEHTAAY